MGKSKLRLGSSTSGTKEPCVNIFKNRMAIPPKPLRENEKEKGRKTPAVHADNKDLWSKSVCQI